MAERDEINTPMVAAVGVLGTVLLVAIVVGLQVLYYSMTDAELARKDAPIVSTALADYVSGQREKLDSYRWVDQSKGVVTIPIARAMDLVVQEVRAAGSKPAGEASDGR